MNTIIRQASVQFIPRVLCMPLHLSSGVIDTVTEARAAVTVYANGREVTGHGAIYLSGQWAWPDAPITYAERDMALQSTCRTIADRLPELCGGEAVHPLELGLRLHEAMLRMAEAPPPLARMMCASPFDAACTMQRASRWVVRRSTCIAHRSRFPAQTACLPVAAPAARLPACCNRLNSTSTPG